jgi:hypothetical protein
MRLVLVLVCLFGLVACGGVSPTPTPAFPKYTADQVVAKITPLGVSDVKPGTRDANAQSPNTTTASRDFAIASIAPKGGQLLLFDNAADVAGMQAWYARFPDLAPYVYVKGNALLQLNSTLPKAEADKFKAALDSLP